MICKYIFTSSSRTIQESFILTMWYVNTGNGEGTDILSLSFILTMWYVNVLFSISLNIVATRFILTMWYVNIVTK